MSRRPNFTKEEMKVLTDGINARQNLLFSSFNNSDTHIAKERAWQHILTEVNAVSTVQRTIDEIRRKWTYIKSETKRKNSQYKKSYTQTGGGSSDPKLQPDETELVVLGIIGPTALNGIDGGVETSNTSIITATGDNMASGSSLQAVGEIVEASCTQNKDGMPYATSNKGTMQSSNSQAGFEILEGTQKKNGLSHTLSNKGTKSGISTKKSTVDEQTANEVLIEIEKERLIHEKERLNIERRRCEVEESRLAVERKRCDMEEIMLDIEKKRLKLEEDKQNKQFNFDINSPFGSQGSQYSSAYQANFAQLQPNYTCM